jgi:hypothetical protein
VVPGTPALVLAAVTPTGGVALVVLRATTSGLATTPDDPVPPWVVAVATVLAALAIAWRALTQRAELRDDRLVCRNTLSTFEVPWDRVDRLTRRTRAGLVTVDVEVSGLRRRLRLGAATRFAGEGADAVADVLRAHPVAGALLDDAGP